MTLLNDALRAYGPPIWQRFTRVVVHMSLRGILVTRDNDELAPYEPYEIVAEGSFQTRRIQLTGFNAPERRCICESDGRAPRRIGSTSVFGRSQVSLRIWTNLPIRRAVLSTV